jgi:hypothetical protein
MAQLDTIRGVSRDARRIERDFRYDAIWRSGLESTPKPKSCHLNVSWMLGS